MKSHKEQRKRVDKESRDRKIRDHDDRVHDHDNIRDIKSRFFEKKIAGKKAENFGLTTDFSSYDDKDTLKSKPSHSIFVDGSHLFLERFLFILTFLEFLVTVNM